MVQLLNDIPNNRARRNELQYRLKHLQRSERIQLLCLALDDPYPPIRHDVAQGLQRELRWSSAGQRPSSQALTRFLEATAAGRAPTHEVTAELEIPRELLSYDSPRARMTACVALEASPRPDETMQILRPLLRSQVADLRYQTLITTHHLAPGSAFLYDTVREALTDDDPEIVVIATQIAVNNGWGDLLEALLQARARLNGEDRLQVTFSVGALLENTGLSPDELPAPARQNMIAECVDALDHEPHTAAAAKTLARLQAREATDELVAITDKWLTHPILKVEAAATLVELGHPRGPDYIEKALKSRRKDARGYALRVVGSHRLEQFFPKLVEVATGDDYHADTATIALADFGGERARRILADLAESHPDEQVRELADSAIAGNLEHELFDTIEPSLQLDSRSFDATP